MSPVQIAEETCCIFDVPAGIKHGLDGGEILPVEVLVDLHATHIDEHGTPLPCPLEGVQSLVQAIEIVGLSFDIHGVGRKTSLASGLCQTDRIEYAFRDAVFGSGGADCALTGSQARLCLRCRADQGERRDCR